MLFESFSLEELAVISIKMKSITFLEDDGKSSCKQLRYYNLHFGTYLKRKNLCIQIYFPE